MHLQNTRLYAVDAVKSVAAVHAVHAVLTVGSVESLNDPYAVEREIEHEERQDQNANR